MEGKGIQENWVMEGVIESFSYKCWRKGGGGSKGITKWGNPIQC